MCRKWKLLKFPKYPDKLEAHFETISKLLPISDIEPQRVENDLTPLPRAKTVEPTKTKADMKIPCRFGQYFTQRSFAIEKKELTTYRQALISSTVEMCPEAIQDEFQTLNENEHGF